MREKLCICLGNIILYFGFFSVGKTKLTGMLYIYIKYIYISIACRKDFDLKLRNIGTNVHNFLIITPRMFLR